MDLKIAIWGGQDDRRLAVFAWLDAFAQGLNKHGIEVIRQPRSQYPPEADLVVFWSHKIKRCINQQIAAHKDYLVIEHGYFGDRVNVFSSARFNGLNGNAEPVMAMEDAPPDRWEEHGFELAPWKTDGDYVLLLGQVPGDASLTQTGFTPEFYEQAAAAVHNVTDLPVRFRPHPKSRQYVRVAGTEPSTGTLSDALAGAALAVTWNSTAGVDAALAGVPVCACDRGSMAWPVASHDPTAPPQRPDRTAWLNHLAYCQWTLEEFADGDAWDHLRMKYEKQNRHAA
jgi:hypothetical protein